MSKPSLIQATYIDNERDLIKLVELLRKESQVGFDTESNSLYAYRGRVCLIQLSTQSEDFILDPLAISNMQALGEIFLNPTIEKIFHAAEYDLLCLKRDFDFDVLNVFDTMAAARVCGYQRVGLGALLELFLNIEVNKKHQTDDWGKRPLPKANLHYAQMDTHYLIKLRDMLYEELAENSNLDEAYEFFEDVIRIEVKPLSFDPDGFWQIGHPNSLTRRQMAVLREVYILREELAQQQDYPTHRLIGNKALITIAQELPSQRNQLFSIHSLPDWVVRHYGDEIIQAIERGRSNRLPNRPPAERPISPELVERYTALHNWRKGQAQLRGVEADVIISKHTLWEVARQLPQTLDELAQVIGIGPWRLKTYGQALIGIVAEFSPY